MTIAFEVAPVPEAPSVQWSNDARVPIARETVVAFFVSSRRRHTRYIGDWSSDVCSSDLFTSATVIGTTPFTAFSVAMPSPSTIEIGRASCRERGEGSGGGRSLVQKKKEYDCPPLV